MSGFLHQFATRSLGLAPQIKARAALPYAAPTADFSITEATSHEATPASAASERPGMEPPHNIRRHVPAIDNALPAPIVAENPAPSARAEAQTSAPAAALPRPASQPRQFETLLDIAPVSQTRPPVVVSPVAAEQKSVPRHLDQAPDTRRPSENTEPALIDLESLVTRLLGNAQSPAKNSPEAATPTPVVTTRQADPRPAGISATRPYPNRESQSRAPQPDSAPEVHITIGRLEVNPPSRPAPAAPAPRPRGPAPLSLSDYLARRNGGRA